ncbi:hypothetical protein CC86DRAFT_76308 [Ophiobolus disseminans]|uniref:Uncharacterized protein n=1 Tax=Ophiobolus disseminans TaxID=1469910 RepID=A0A6A6ZPR8_9PLEO|nr:hypothetical protein CC86DRAFT_76308 [Ophiobolus disseminans]
MRLPHHTQSMHLPFQNVSVVRRAFKLDLHHNTPSPPHPFPILIIVSFFEVTRPPAKCSHARSQMLHETGSSQRRASSTNPQTVVQRRRCTNVEFRLPHSHGMPYLWTVSEPRGQHSSKTDRGLMSRCARQRHFIHSVCLRFIGRANVPKRKVPLNLFNDALGW